jgi:antitoxin (DNA-binding transcriptional repressor) of toxin-antitoxin stability system
VSGQGRKYRQVLTTNDKGNIAEAAITLEAIKLGIGVLKPVREHGRYDLLFDLGTRFVRVQCKWGALDRAAGVICVRVGGSRHTPAGYVRSTYTGDEVDAIAVYCGQLEEVFLVPIEAVEGRSAIRLRIDPPRNSQEACINLAKEYRLGAIAQLGERPAGSREVVGSSPTSSTPQSDREIVVGSNGFRDRFGYCIERAHAGGSILITRHGRRFARLGPPDPQLATTDNAAVEEPAGDQEGPPPGIARTSP